MILRRGDARDITRFWGVAPPDRDIYLEVIERNGAILGAAGCYWDEDGRCWVFMDGDLHRKAKTVYRRAKQFIAELSMSHDVIYAYRSADIPTSERWLTRLGFSFHHVDEQGQEVWAWRRSEES